MSSDLKADKVGACRAEKERLVQMERNFLRLFGVRKMRVSAEERRVRDGVYSSRRSDR